MGITTAVMTEIAKALKGDALTLFNNANAHIGSGDSSSAFAAGQTDLQAATNKFRQPMEATFPTRTGAALTFKSIFAAGDANYVWNEWGVFNAAAAGVMLNRKVEALGTKTSSQEWEFTVSLTFASAD